MFYGVKYTIFRYLEPCKCDRQIDGQTLGHKVPRFTTMCGQETIFFENTGKPLRFIMTPYCKEEALRG